MNRKDLIDNVVNNHTLAPEEKKWIHSLWYELEGVIIDTENSGFDDVCLETIKRVQKELMGQITKPIFEVRYTDNDKHYKIYEDGRIEGFEKSAIIVNRIPPRIYEAQAKLKDANYATDHPIQDF